MKERVNHLRLCFALGALTLALVGSARGQTPDEHASHHPAPGGAGSASPVAPVGTTMPSGGNPAQTAGGSMGESQPAAGMTNSVPGPGAMGGNQSAGAGGAGMGMGAGMGEMMKQMGTPPRKELYPSLMALPDGMTLEQRSEIDQLAQGRMKTGVALLAAGLAQLSDSTVDEDYAAMEQATAQMRDGLAQFETGVAARRLLSEGKATRNLALDWFKREMNLGSPIRPDEPRTILGVRPFHLFTMVLLVGFALAMVGMYFFKMRRAAALFGRLEPDANASPPGSPPPVVGAPGQSTPLPSPPSDKPAPPAPPAPAARPPAALATLPKGLSALAVPHGDTPRAIG